MQELLEHVRRHKVNIDGNVCTVMVTTLVLEVCDASKKKDIKLKRNVSRMAKACFGWALERDLYCLQVY